jgi:oligopeptide transport system substrate-binding protein
MKSGFLYPILCLAFLLPVACRVQPRTELGTEKGILYINNGAEPADLDPHVVTGVPEQRLCSTLFESLVNLNPETLEPIPGVAESWTVSSDGTHYTFHLRGDATWSNGDPVTAGDFVYSWRRILSPSLAAEYGYLLYCLKNGKGYNSGQVKNAEQVGVHAADDRTLEVELENPVPHFLLMQTHTAFMPVYGKTLRKYGSEYERGNRWTRPGNFVGNGAFELVEWNPDVVIVVRKRPGYWDAASVKLNGIRFYAMDNLQTEERSFRSGLLHVTESLLSSKVPVYQKAANPSLQIDPYFGVYFYRINANSGPLKDTRIRRALGLALNRTEITDKVLKGGQFPATGYTPPGVAGYNPGNLLTYDPEKARALMREAGYTDGVGIPEIELLYNTSENHKLIAEAVQSMWKKELGVKVTLLNQDWKVYLNSVNRMEYQIARASWVGDFLDPVTFLDCLTSGNGNNHTGYASPEYDDLIDAAGREADSAKRYEMLAKAERQLMDDMPIIPLYFYTRAYLKSADVQNWKPNVLGYISFRELALKQATLGGTR